MHSFSGFLSTMLLLLVTGCAAPMTKMVATHQDETIDQELFKEGDQVWVSYQDKTGTVAAKRGFVLDADSTSVMLDVGPGRTVDIEYRWIQTLRHPAKDRWYISLSAGTFLALKMHDQELPSAKRLTGSGVSFRYGNYLNGDIEGNFSIGSKRARFPSWIGISGSGHFYTIIPRTYFLLGLGYVWKSTDDLYSSEHLGICRIGFGVKNSVSKKFNIRVEAYPIGFGLSIYFERRIQ